MSHEVFSHGAIEIRIRATTFCAIVCAWSLFVPGAIRAQAPWSAEPQLLTVPGATVPAATPTPQIVPFPAVAEPPAEAAGGVQQVVGIEPIVQPAPPQITHPEAVAEAPDAAAPVPLPADTQPSQALSQADVERIVADYLEKREAEKKSAAEAYVVGSDTALSAKWNNGLELQSKNKDFRVHVGGRTQFDTSFFSNDAYLETPSSVGGINGGLTGGSQPLTDSMQFRRARLPVDGTIYEQVDFAFEYEFLNDVSVAAPGTNAFGQTANALAFTAPAATDLWVNFGDLPILGNIRVGNQKNPIGMEHLQSSRYLDFIERSYNQDLFYAPFNNGFSPGIMAWNTEFDNRASWAAGVFAANMNSGTNSFGYGLGNEYAYTFRGTMLPFYDADGRYMAHLGMSYEHRDADDGHVRVRTRGNIRNGPPGPFNAVYADTTYLQASGQDLINFEGALVWGPWMVQSEYCFSNIHDAVQTINVAAPVGRGTVASHGGYVEVLYFITGEHRAYSFERSAFDRVVPFSNSFRVINRRGGICQGWGAWQCGIRYDHADLNNSGINGGMLDGITLGLNWFLNPNMKVQWNWDYTHRGTVATAFGNTQSGDIVGFGTRLAIDF